MNTNEAIVNDLKYGSDDALRSIYDQFNNMLVSYAKYTIRNPLLAEDFVQDAFCTLWENRIKLNASQPIQAYLFKIVHSRCVDYLRKANAKCNYRSQTEVKLREASLTQAPFENTVISGIMATEAQVIIEQTLQSFPDLTRKIFLLSRNEQLKNAEIAEQTGLSVKAIEYHIGKALGQFRIALKDFL